MLTLEEFMAGQEKYFLMLKNMEKSINTIDKYALALRNFAAFAESTSKQKEICKNCFIEYKQYLKNKYKPNTTNLYIIALNKYLRYLEHDELRIQTLKMQRRNSLENCLTFEEYKKMLASAKTQKNNIYYIMRAIASTGVRVGELKFFTVEAISRGCCTIANKGNIRRNVMPQAVCDELIDFCKENNIYEGYVFFGEDPQKPISEVTVLRRLKRVAALAGVDPCKAFPHNLRHLFAKTFIDIYSDISELADILGHTTIETTRIYTRTSIEEKRRKLEHLKL